MAGANTLSSGTAVMLKLRIASARCFSRSGAAADDEEKRQRQMNDHHRMGQPAVHARDSPLSCCQRCGSEVGYCPVWVAPLRGDKVRLAAYSNTVPLPHRHLLLRE